MVPTCSYSYMVEGIEVKVLSANCQGLQDSKKCFDVLNYLRNQMQVLFASKTLTGKSQMKEKLDKSGMVIVS